MTEKTKYLEMAVSQTFGKDPKYTVDLAAAFEDFCKGDVLKIYAINLSFKHATLNCHPIEFYLDRANSYLAYLTHGEGVSGSRQLSSGSQPSSLPENLQGQLEHGASLSPDLGLT